jgi:hypothetical protein
LRKLRHCGFGGVFLIESLWVKDISHLKELKVSLELWSQVCPRKVVPIWAGSSFLLLQNCISGIQKGLMIECRVVYLLSVTMNLMKIIGCRVIPKTGPKSASCSLG